MADFYKPIRGEIQLCFHCGDQAGYRLKYCLGCKTSAQRKKVDEENEMIKAGWKSKSTKISSV